MIRRTEMAWDPEDHDENNTRGRSSAEAAATPKAAATAGASSPLSATGAGTSELVLRVLSKRENGLSWKRSRTDRLRW